MDVITTHINADFDCLGAMVAARRLYPDALLVFPGAQEKSMRDFFLRSSGYALDFTRLRDLDLRQVSRLILVDCQHSSRIGRFAEILDRPGLDVHIYDHHVDSPGDIPAGGGVIRECGSTTTIIAQLLMAQGESVTPMEATLMLLGIYEDTGSLTFATTTVDDYYAAAWLLSAGGNLNTVADFMTQELTAEQVRLLNELLQSVRMLTVNGVEIAVASAAVDYYVGDIAVLAHMMRDMRNLDALFLVVAMGARVYLVGRSRIPEVNVRAVLREFGGGGHATAAAASVRDLTLIQVLDRLQEALPLWVNPRRTARDLMSSPVKTMALATDIATAGELLARYGVNAMPVMDGEQMVGIVSRRIVERAIYHGLGELPVAEYMHTEFLRAAPDTPLHQIQDYIIAQHRRFVPIFADGRLVGAVTRTDLLRYLYDGARGGVTPLDDVARELLPERHREVAGLLRKYLAPEQVELLQALGELGDELQLPVYAVGGLIRDLLLGAVALQPELDLDITVEGDGILFAETFAARRGCRVRSHAAFGTAVLIFADGFKVDVASTRLEYYESPAALPVVERSSLRLDLYRRDFTINTMAVALSRERFGLLTDFFGAQRDLADRVLRVLHNLSFVEDPTRVFRAIRFEQRLDFRISRHTENLIRNAVRMGFLERLGGRRLLGELVQILKEREPLKAIERMAGMQLLRFIHPELQLTDETRRLLAELQRTLHWYELLYRGEAYEPWQAYLLGLCWQLDDDQFTAVGIRLAIGRRRLVKLQQARRNGQRPAEQLERLAGRKEPLLDSSLYRLLDGLPVEELLCLMAATRQEAVRRAISRFITTLQGVSPLLGGHDLVAAGIPPGPELRALLEALRDACLDGRVQSREAELAFVRAHAGTVA